MDIVPMLLLLAVMPSILIRSSQAYRCYDCDSFSSSDCDNPTSSTGTCTGDVCFRSKVESSRHRMRLFVFSYILCIYTYNY